jgi:hypothetical protein
LSDRLDLGRQGGFFEGLAAFFLFSGGIVRWNEMRLEVEVEVEVRS